MAGKQKTPAMKRKAVLSEEIDSCVPYWMRILFAVMAAASSDSVPKRDGECVMGAWRK